MQIRLPSELHFRENHGTQLLVSTKLPCDPLDFNCIRWLSTVKVRDLEIEADTSLLTLHQRGRRLPESNAQLPQGPVHLLHDLLWGPGGGSLRRLGAASCGWKLFACDAG